MKIGDGVSPFAPFSGQRADFVSQEETILIVFVLSGAGKRGTLPGGAHG